MKIQQVFQTSIVVELTEIPNIPDGFILKDVGKAFVHNERGETKAIELFGVIETSKNNKVPD